MEKNIKTYKKTFEGNVVKIVKPVATIKFEKTEYHSKFERFSKKTISLRARIPKEFLDKIKINDIATITKCKPLSKTIHYLVIKVREDKKTKSTKEIKNKK